jgi:hypothetical protein
VAIDASIVHAMCPSSRNTGADVLAAARFTKKEQKYSSVCAASEYHGIEKDPEAFSPFVVFSSGAVCCKSRPLLEALSQLETCQLTPLEIETMISCACVNGIGAVLGHVSGVVSRRAGLLRCPPAAVTAPDTAPPTG